MAWAFLDCCRRSKSGGRDLRRNGHSGSLEVATYIGTFCDLFTHLNHTLDGEQFNRSTEGR